MGEQPGDRESAWQPGSQPLETGGHLESQIHPGGLPRQCQPRLCVRDAGRRSVRAGILMFPASQPLREGDHWIAAEIMMQPSAMDEQALRPGVIAAAKTVVLKVITNMLHEMPRVFGAEVRRRPLGGCILIEIYLRGDQCDQSLH